MLDTHTAVRMPQVTNSSAPKPMRSGFGLRDTDFIPFSIAFWDCNMVISWAAICRAFVRCHDASEDAEEIEQC
jgi:hypothetical protein